MDAPADEADGQPGIRISSVGQLLRRVRREADLNQREAAALAGVSKSRWARAERDATALGVHELIALLDAVGARLAVLDASGRELAPMRADCAHDRGGRHFPAHLDLEPMPEMWPGRWGAGLRYDRPEPWVTFRHRPQRDQLRRREGSIPPDHFTDEEVADLKHEQAQARRRRMEQLRRGSRPSGC